MRVQVVEHLEVCHQSYLMSLSVTKRVRLLSLFRNNKSAGFSIQNYLCNSSNFMDFFRCKLHIFFEVRVCFAYLGQHAA
jgi:hypothetical protein